jgi:hypothetical protein
VEVQAAGTNMGDRGGSICVAWVAVSSVEVVRTNKTDGLIGKRELAASAGMERVSHTVLADGRVLQAFSIL